ncbi:3592_t:CDS:1, partial [Racocetra persica]
AVRNKEEELYKELSTWVGFFKAHVCTWAKLLLKERRHIKNQYDEWCWEWR